MYIYIVSQHTHIQSIWAIAKHQQRKQFDHKLKKKTKSRQIRTKTKNKKQQNTKYPSLN